MGRRGPAPKPTALRKIDGGAGHRPLNAREPRPAGEPEAPEFLSERGRQIWEQLVPRLAKTGLATSIDAGALGRYCELFVLWIDALAFVRKHGDMYPVHGEPTKKHPKGRVVGSRSWPTVGHLLKYEQRLIQLEREFGMTPSARTRIRLENEGAAAKDNSELKRRMFGAGVIGRVGGAAGA